MASEEARVDAVIRFCRGCGKELPAGTSLLFHPECRKSDKRRRVAHQRRREAERREKWIRRQHCPKCGASLEELAFSNRQPLPERSCDASPTQRRLRAHTDGSQGQGEQIAPTD